MVLCVVSKLQTRRPKKRGSISPATSSPAVMPTHLFIHFKIAGPSAVKLHVVPKLKMLRGTPSLAPICLHEVLSDKHVFTFLF